MPVSAGRQRVANRHKRRPPRGTALRVKPAELTDARGIWKLNVLGQLLRPNDQIGIELKKDSVERPCAVDILGILCRLFGT